MSDRERVVDADGDRPATLSGKWAVVATLSLFVVVPVITFVAWTLMEADLSDVEDRPLRWSERSDWRSFEVRPKPLERGMMSQGRTGQTYKDYGFHPSEAMLASIERCRALAELPREAFGSAETRAALESEWALVSGHFYAAALMALSLEQSGASHLGAVQPGDAWWGHAFAAAPAAVVQGVTWRGGPADGRPASADVGTVAFAFDTVDAETDTIDTSLVLVYPGVRTDVDGAWRLPVFKTIFRVVDPALGVAVPNDPQSAPWWTYVGKVGRLPTISVGYESR